MRPEHIHCGLNVPGRGLVTIRRHLHIAHFTAVSPRTVPFRLLVSGILKNRLPPREDFARTDVIVPEL
jgi:hypothetical protein